MEGLQRDFQKQKIIASSLNSLMAMKGLERSSAYRKRLKGTQGKLKHQGGLSDTIGVQMKNIGGLLDIRPLIDSQKEKTFASSLNSFLAMRGLERSSVYRRLLKSLLIFGKPLTDPLAREDREKVLWLQEIIKKSLGCRNIQKGFLETF